MGRLCLELALGLFFVNEQLVGSMFAIRKPGENRLQGTKNDDENGEHPDNATNRLEHGINLLSLLVTRWKDDMSEPRSP